MTDFLLASGDAEIHPIFLRLFMAAAGLAVLAYAIFQASHGGAFCHTGATRFSATRFFRFEQAPLQVSFNLLMEFAVALLLIYLALMGVS